MIDFNLTRRQLKRLSDAYDYGYDDLLEDADGAPIQGNGKAIEERCLQWIREMESAYELDVFADLYNWDDGAEPLLEIIRHPLCDLGTAAKIYWLAAGNREGEYRKYHKEFYELLDEIEQRVKDGRYTSEMRYERDNWRSEESLNRLKPRPPEFMCATTPGVYPPEFDINLIGEYPDEE